MKLKYNSRSAFTIVELLVVMGITALVGTILIVGLDRFRTGIQVQQASSDLLSNLRLAQNKARNAVLSEVKPRTTDVFDAVVDGYGIFFDGSGDYSMRYCMLNTSSGTTRYDCTGVEKASLKAKEYGAIKLVSATPAKCQGIVFAKLTGNITAAASNLATIDNTGTCNLNVQYPLNVGQPSVISIDFANDTISQ